MTSSSFPSQGSYPDGATACTSIAWHWAVACLENLIEPLLDKNQAKSLFECAIEAHKYICNANYTSTHKLLTNHELESHLSHLKLKCSEFNVVDDDLEIDESMRLFWVPRHKFKQLLLHRHAKKFAMIITYCAHTHAIFGNAESITVFDSMYGRAETMKRSSSDFIDNIDLLANTYKADEIAVTLITK